LPGRAGAAGRQCEISELVCLLVYSSIAGPRDAPTLGTGSVLPVKRSAPRRERAIRPGLTPLEAGLRKRCNVCAPDLRPPWLGSGRHPREGLQSRPTSSSFFSFKLPRRFRLTCGPCLQTLENIRNVFSIFGERNFGSVQTLHNSTPGQHRAASCTDHPPMGSAGYNADSGRHAISPC
jgi:hypothetical protein